MTISIGVGTSGGPLVADTRFDVGGQGVAWSRLESAFRVEYDPAKSDARAVETYQGKFMERDGQDLDEQDSERHFHRLMQIHR